MEKGTVVGQTLLDELQRAATGYHHAEREKTETGRYDEAVLDHIRKNVTEVMAAFVRNAEQSIAAGSANNKQIQAIIAGGGDPDRMLIEILEYHLSRLGQIWRKAQEEAETHGDPENYCKEEAKLEVLEALRRKMQQSAQ